MMICNDVIRGAETKTDFVVNEMKKKIDNLDL